MTSDAHEGRLLIGGCFRWCLICFAVLSCIGAGVFIAQQRMAERTEAPLGYLGSPQRGRALLSAHGCPACHLVPGSALQGMVGPPLTGMGSRSYIAGRFPNARIDMEQWIRRPQEMKPGTAMPDLGVSERDARDMASYLATLR